MIADHTLLTDADLEPVDEVALQAAIAKVCAMSNAEFFAACAATGRPVQSDPRILAAWNRHEARS